MTNASTSRELGQPAQTTVVQLLLHSIRHFFGLAKSNIYDLCIVHVTHVWYEAMLEELDEGAVVLDVGIGTATALVQNRKILLKKNIRVIGIDYDADYVAAANVHIQEASIGNCIRVYHHDVYKMDELQGKIVLPHGSQGGFESQKDNEKIQFDAILFSGTFPVLPDKEGAFNALQGWHHPDKYKIMIAQAYQRATPPLARFFKKMLKYFTSIDHGELITEAEAKELFEKRLKKACKLKVVSHEVIDDSIDNALEAAYLTILEPMGASKKR